MTLTPQQILDKVATHLLAQGERSMGPNGCAYRGSEGRMCAVGCLIPDEIYDPGIEGASAYSVLLGITFDPGETSYDAPAVEAFAPKFAALVGVENEDLLRELQSIHDDSPESLWRERLMTLASQRGLDVNF